MEIYREGSRPDMQGHEQWFTGKIRMIPVAAAEETARPGIVAITFQPGARTNWHLHPLGQTLIITEGLCRSQTEGRPVEVLRLGDVVWFAPDERHWRGAAPDSAMSQIAVQAALGGRTVDWEGPVEDRDYEATPGT